MQRRRLLALCPALALAACSGPGGDGPATGDGSAPGAPSDGGGSGGFDDSGSGADGSADESATAPSSQPPSLAESLLDELSDRELAGQLVLVGISAGSSIPPEVLAEHHVGGFFLIGTWRTAVAVEDLVAAAQDGSAPQLQPLLAVDQEGGQVRMLRGDAARKTPSAAQLGQEGPDAVAEAYRSIGEDLRSRGLHVDLAPVADLVDPQLGDANDPVGALRRGFGTEPQDVGQCVATAVEALAAHEISATLKHFPGLGRVEQNTDFSAEGIVDEQTGPEDPTLAAFTAGIDAGAELVMLSSAIYPLFEAGTPAMFSRAVVQDLLRDRLGFEGLVITDDIGAAEAVADVPVPERATRLLEAGGDAVLTAAPGIAGELVDAIQAWADASEENRQRVRESAGRMLALKERHGLLDP